MSTLITADPLQQMAIIYKYADLQHEANRVGVELTVNDTTSLVFKYEGKYVTCRSLQDASVFMRGIEIGMLLQRVKTYEEAERERSEKNNNVIQPEEPRKP